MHTYIKDVSPEVFDGRVRIALNGCKNAIYEPVHTTGCDLRLTEHCLELLLEVVDSFCDLEREFLLLLRELLHLDVRVEQKGQVERVASAIHVHRRRHCLSTCRSYVNLRGFNRQLRLLRDRVLTD